MADRYGSNVGGTEGGTHLYVSCPNSAYLNVKDKMHEKGGVLHRTWQHGIPHNGKHAGKTAKSLLRDHVRHAVSPFSGQLVTRIYAFRAYTSKGHDSSDSIVRVRYDITERDLRG